MSFQEYRTEVKIVIIPKKKDSEKVNGNREMQEKALSSSENSTHCVREESDGREKKAVSVYVYTRSTVHNFATHTQQISDYLDLKQDQKIR